jgi:GTPase SAR1 family protein
MIRDMFKYYFQSAKTNQNVEQVFFTIARDIKQRLTETVAAAAEVDTLAFRSHPLCIICHLEF